MSSRTLPATIDTLAVVTAMLYSELSATIQVHAAELPAGWTLAKTALIQPDGGLASVNVPELTERFTIHSYGSTPALARSVSMAVFDALHRWQGQQVTVGAAVVFVPFIRRDSGPIWNREPETEWPRFSDVYTVVCAEWAKP